MTNVIIIIIIFLLYFFLTYRRPTVAPADALVYNLWSEINSRESSLYAYTLFFIRPGAHFPPYTRILYEIAIFLTYDGRKPGFLCPKRCAPTRLAFK